MQRLAKPTQKKKSNPEMKRQQQQAYKQQEQERQRKTMRNLMIGTVVVIAVVVALIILIPNNKTEGIRTTFDYSQMPMKGNANAPVKIVEFADFKCPICKMYNEQILPKIEADFVDKGVASLYFANFPFIGPDSTTAALAAESVYHQKSAAFWPYLNEIYTHQKDENTEWATPDYLVKLAEDAKLGIDTTKLRQNIDNKTYADQVNAQFKKGQELNIPGTPSIFINGVQYTGDLGDYNALKAAIEKAQADAGNQTGSEG
nr:DsbA family protein [Paenibacillus sp. SGZ-1014]